MLDTLNHLIGGNADEIGWWQMSIRALLVFAYAVLLYRIAPRRAFTNLSALDMVVTVIAGSSLSRALTANAPLLPTFAAMGALVALHALLAAAASRSDRFSTLVKGRPVALIRDGRVDREAARRSFLGERDLEEELRLKGLASPEQVGEGRIERNGRFSAIKKS